MRPPPALSAPNQTKPFPSPPKCSGISRFHNDRRRHVWCLGIFSCGRSVPSLSPLVWGTTTTWMRSRRISERVLASPGGTVMVAVVLSPSSDSMYLLREGSGHGR
ncbi:hypothetical protein AVEN_73221-1 [Araneus ventricosus]|uniref:Uncharacterized protein n=1 Tax=Araneus ventricosus TaxID=182803 RepID=A0A4Y2LWI5_ARAVE|nr:hypothetical protein AVEN_73221-1 [Araneus ventricosus]